MKTMEKMKSAAMETAVKTALAYLERDPEANIPKMMKLVDQVCPDDWYVSQRKAVRGVIEQKNHWYDLMLKLYDLDAGVRKTFFTNFIINASLKGSARQIEASAENDCNVPWAILLDPTSACNLHCTGCWAAEYGHQLNLSVAEIDSIITQGKALGTFMFIYTGGEPMVRKEDLLAICRKHPDCEFLAFTNGTLIDEAFCQAMLEVKNFVPALSLEGFEEANDSRRGAGCYATVRAAMRLLKQYKLPFGVSTCYTSANVQDVSSERYFDQMIQDGALFAWFFHYMPVGNEAAPVLMPSPDQRAWMIQQIRHFRQTKPIFTIDFQNDAEYVGGCIAGGRRYLHINANGDVDPCVFIHYSNMNIREHTLLEALQSPLFKAYYHNQPFNGNMLRPCPMLENPEILPRLVRQSGAVSTDLQSPESAEHLCAKCQNYAQLWQIRSQQIWQELHSASGQRTVTIVI